MNDSTKAIFEFAEEKHPSLQQEISAMDALSSVCGLTPMTDTEKARFIATRQAVANAAARRIKWATIIVTLVFWPAVIAMGVMLPHLVATSAASQPPIGVAYCEYWVGLLVVMTLPWLFCIHICRQIFQ